MLRGIVTGGLVGYKLYQLDVDKVTEKETTRKSVQLLDMR